MLSLFLLLFNRSFNDSTYFERNFMDFFEFECALLEYLHGEFDEEIKVNDVCKTNGVVLRGVTVIFKDTKACPTVYIDDFFASYNAGEPFESICERIKEILLNSRIELDFELSDIENYENVKEKLLVKLINTDKNKELLKDLPNVNFLDLSAVFYILVNDEDYRYGSILVHNSLFERFNVSLDKMFEDAKANLNKLLVNEIVCLEDLVLEIFKERNVTDERLKEEILDRKASGETSLMYVLSNKRRTFGAAAMLDERLLQSFSDKIDTDFYILPSSIHELILVPDNGMTDPDELRSMVETVNETEVLPADVLSDKVYYYSRLLNKVSCL